MILADLPTNVSLGTSVFASVLALALAITNWITLKSPQRREVFFTGTPVDKKDFDVSVAETRKETLRVAAEVQHAKEETARILMETQNRVMGALNQEVGAVHNRVNDILGKVSEVAGVVKGLSGEISELREDLRQKRKTE